MVDDKKDTWSKMLNSKARYFTESTRKHDIIVLLKKSTSEPEC